MGKNKGMPQYCNCKILISLCNHNNIDFPKLERNPISFDIFRFVKNKFLLFPLSVGVKRKKRYNGRICKYKNFGTMVYLCNWYVDYNPNIVLYNIRKNSKRKTLDWWVEILSDDD